MPGKLKDPRIISCAIAVACMFVDDLPEPQYNTFHDPGAAAMLSIILANILTLVGRRGWRWFIWLALCFALIFKFFIQPFFWVQNAWFWDIGTLVVAHVLLGLLTARGQPLRLRMVMSVATTIGVLSAIFVAFIVGLWGTSWIVFWMQLEIARVLIPWAFWTAVLLVENRFLIGTRLRPE
jgi:hypothetical protein